MVGIVVRMVVNVVGGSRLAVIVGGGVGRSGSGGNGFKSRERSFSRKTRNNSRESPPTDLAGKVFNREREMNG